MQLVGPRDQLETAIGQLGIAVRNVDAAAAVLISDRTDFLKIRPRIARLRVEMIALQRELSETAEELTPMRPASRTDVRAAFATTSDAAIRRKSDRP